MLDHPAADLARVTVWAGDLAPALVPPEATVEAGGGDADHPDLLPLDGAGFRLVGVEGAKDPHALITRPEVRVAGAVAGRVAGLPRRDVATAVRAATPLVRGGGSVHRVRFVAGSSAISQSAGCPTDRTFFWP